MSLNNDVRKQLIAKIHVLSNQLGLDRDTYEDLLYSETGKKSCSDLTTKSEFDKVIKRLEPKKQSNKTTYGTEAQWRYARYLWHELYILNKINNPTQKALENYIHNRYKSVIGIREIAEVIEQLKEWKNR